MTSRLERIVSVYGGVLLDGGRRALIPGPNHGPGDRSVSLIETDDGRILIHCFSPKDDWRSVRAMLRARGLLPDGTEEGPQPILSPAKAIRPQSTEPTERAVRYWRQSIPVAGTIGERYLAKRAICAALRSPSLGFHPRMTSLDDRLRRPALLAQITTMDGALQGVQATLLTRQGSQKAAVATPRRVIGKLLGGAVRLSEPDDVLVIAEGFESAASAQAALGSPTWALLSAHNLALFVPPPRLRRLVVAIDDDEAGRAAFARLKTRLQASLRLECAPPPDGHNDWNDWARAVDR